MTTIWDFDANQVLKAFYAKKEEDRAAKRAAQQLAKQTSRKNRKPPQTATQTKRRPRLSDAAISLATANKKLVASDGVSILRAQLEQAARLRNRATTSPLRAYALWLYQLILEVDVDRRSDLTIALSLMELAQQSRCPNCGKEITTATLFCCELCQQEAITVRYCRRVTREDLRCLKHDIQEGIGIRLLMLLGGGYPAKARTTSKALRDRIFERDSYTCRLCGAPATQIDHISDSSNDPSNLRAVCKPCNLELAVRRAMVGATESDPELSGRLSRYVESLALRIACPLPSRVCDDQNDWQAAQYHLRKARRTRFVEMAG